MMTMRGHKIKLKILPKQLLNIYSSFKIPISVQAPTETLLKNYIVNNICFRPGNIFY